MTATRDDQIPPARRRMILGAFSVIIIGFAAGNLVSAANMRGVEADTRTLVADTIASIELVSRIARDIDQTRLLVDQHVSERDIQRRKQIEQRIEELEADLAAAARAYDPISNSPGERRIWENLRAETSAIREPINRSLELSRGNHEAEARASMVAIDGRFDAISRAVDALDQANHLEGKYVRARIDARHHWAASFLLVLTLGGATFALLLARRVARILDRQDAQVRAAVSNLEQQNRELDAFAGRVAHDLRGPLTTISLSATRLAEQLPREAGTFTVLERGVTRMEGLIQDLLTLSRVDVQAPGMICETTSVASAVEQDLRPAVANVGGRLDITMAPATVHCGEGLLRQILSNLGENAVKYRRTDVALQVRVDGRIVGHSYELRVSDNGSGMSPSDTSRAFEPLFRSERVRSSPGTGLGLAIVARIIHASGGTISIDSLLGHGTTFVIRLPLEGLPEAHVDERFTVPPAPP